MGPGTSTWESVSPVGSLGDLSSASPGVPWLGVPVPPASTKLYASR